MGNFLKMDMRKMVGIHQGRERMDVFLVILLPLFLMVAATYTNAWALAQGHLSFDQDRLLNTIEALLRGLFTEVLVFAMFMICRAKWRGWKRASLAIVIPALIGVFAVIVSAGSGFAWASSPEMKGMVVSVTNVTGVWFADIFKLGLGLLFPVALAVLALYDAGHVVKEHVDNGREMSELAVHVESAEHFQSLLLQEQKNANVEQKEACKQIARANAQRAVQAAQTGNLDFGLGDALQKMEQRRQTQQLPQLPAPQTRVTPVSQQLPAPQFAPPPDATTGQFRHAQTGFPGGPVPNIPVRPPMPSMPTTAMPTYPPNPYQP